MELARSTGRPRLALASAVIGAVSLIGGWTWAAAAQPGGFDWARQSISDLAASATAHRWIMTTGFVVSGLAYLTTAYAMPLIGRVARGLLAGAGVLVLIVAAVPVPGAGVSSKPHVAASIAAFGLLAVWPWFSAATGGGWALRRTVGRSAATCLSLMSLILLIVMLNKQPWFGLLERGIAAAEVLWTVVAAGSAWWVAGRPTGPRPIRRLVALGALVVLGALGGTATTVLSPTTAQTRYYSADLTLSLNPFDSSRLQARTVFGDINVGFRGLAPGIVARPEVKASITDLLAHNDVTVADLQPSDAEIGSAVRGAGVALGLKFAIGALAVALLGSATYAVWHRRRPSRQVLGVASLAWVAACAITALGVTQTYQPGHQREFTSTGVLGVVQQNNAIFSDVEERAKQVTPYLRNLLALSAALQQKYAPASLDNPTAARILLVSDIHGGNQYPLMKTIIAEEHIDAVIDSGDLVNFGSPVELSASGIAAGIRSLGVPYLFIRGNHDATTATDASVLDALRAIPNVILLQPSPSTYTQVGLHGVQIAGFNDPRWFGDSNTDNAAKQQPARAAFEKAFADRLKLDILVSHEPAAVRGLKNSAILVNGHMHTPDLEANRVQVGTFTGGGPFSHFLENSDGEELIGQPSSFDILTFGDDCRLNSLTRYRFRNVIEGRPAYDDVSLINGSVVTGNPAAGGPARTCSPTEPLTKTTVTEP